MRSTSLRFELFVKEAISYCFKITKQAKKTQAMKTIHRLYTGCRKNPNHQIPSHHNVFGKIHQRSRNTYSLSRQCYLSARRKSSTLRGEEGIPARMEHNPATNVRRISIDVGVSVLLVLRILQEQLLYTTV